MKPLNAMQKKLIDPNGVVLVYGDINNDSNVAADDALSVLRFTTGLDTFLDDAQQAQADVDGDTTITSNDALFILRFSVGMTDAKSTAGQEFTFGGKIEKTTYNVCCKR